MGREFQSWPSSALMDGFKCVFVYVVQCVHVYACMCIYVCVCTYVLICVYVFVCMCIVIWYTVLLFDLSHRWQFNLLIIVFTKNLCLLMNQLLPG